MQSSGTWQGALSLFCCKYRSTLVFCTTVTFQVQTNLDKKPPRMSGTTASATLIIAVMGSHVLTVQSQLRYYAKFSLLLREFNIFTEYIYRLISIAELLAD